MNPAGTVRRTVLLCLCAVAAVLGAFVFSVTREAVPSPETLREHGVFILPSPRDIAPFVLVDDRGEPFANDDLQGAWTFMFFGFTHCPDVCPATLSIFAQAQQRLAAEGVSEGYPFRVVLASVDPERDRVGVLHRYVSAFSDRIRGVTGDRLVLAELARQVNVVFSRVPLGDGYSVDHSSQIVIVNPAGHYHGFIKMPHSVDNIVMAYHALPSSF